LFRNSVYFCTKYVSIFRAENEGILFLLNIGIYLRVNTASKPRTSSSSSSQQCGSQISNSPISRSIITVRSSVLLGKVIFVQLVKKLHVVFTINKISEIIFMHYLHKVHIK
jgi:hypothetical protein